MALLIIDHWACIKFIRNSRSFLLPKNKIGKIFILRNDTIRISTDCCMETISFRAKEVTNLDNTTAVGIVNYLNTIASENSGVTGDGNGNAF